MYSLYFAFSTFSGLGDSEMYPDSPSEAVFMIVYLMVNLVLAAYVLGTVTMLIVKSDKRSKVYRERVTNLHTYSTENELPTVSERAGGGA